MAQITAFALEEDYGGRNSVKLQCNRDNNTAKRQGI